MTSPSGYLYQIARFLLTRYFRFSKNGQDLGHAFNISSDQRNQQASNLFYDESPCWELSISSLLKILTLKIIESVLWCAPGRCEANFRPSRGVGAGRSHFAPRAGALGRGEAILRPGWGVGAGRGHFAPRAGALGRGAYVFWALWCAPRPGALAAPL